MDGAITSKRKYPAYTTAQLEQFVADSTKPNAQVVNVIAMQDEIDRRKNGTAPMTVIPQLVPCRTCKGSGVIGPRMIAEEPCMDCGGTGNKQ